MATESLKNDRYFPVFCLCSLIFQFFFKIAYLVKIIWTNILQGKKYGVVQMVSPISCDFLSLAIILNCFDRFSSKTDKWKIAFVSQNVRSLKKFTEGNARKSTVNFAFSGNADVIKHRENLRFHLSMRRLLKLALSVRTRGHKTIGSHLKLRLYNYFNNVNAK